LSIDGNIEERRSSRANESQQGTSVNYAVRRLGKERPDLLDKVKAGELSPYRAMVEAGFTVELVSVPGEPEPTPGLALLLNLRLMRNPDAKSILMRNSRSGVHHPRRPILRGSLNSAP